MDHLSKTYLVQRVRVRDKVEEKAVGVDRHFSFDYMGSAEFEFGQLPKAIGAMRKDLKYLYVKPKEIKHNRHRCWYVGTKKGLEEATEFFKDQLKPHWKDREWQLKEFSCIADSYGTEADRSPYSNGIIAWWDVSVRSGRTPWIIFMSKLDAEKWLEDLRTAST